MDTNATQSQEGFRYEIVRSYPETNLCEDAWKIDKYVKLVFGSWKQIWMMIKMRTSVKNEEPTGSMNDNAIVELSTKELKLDNVTATQVPPTKSNESELSSSSSVSEP